MIKLPKLTEKTKSRLLIGGILLQQLTGTASLAAEPQTKVTDRVKTQNIITNRDTVTNPGTNPVTTPDAPTNTRRLVQDNSDAYKIETAISDVYHILSTCLIGPQGLQTLERNRQRLDSDYEIISEVSCTSEVLQDFKSAEQLIQQGATDYQDWHNAQKVQQGNELMRKAKELLYAAAALLRTLQPLIDKEVKEKKKPAVIPLPPQPQPKKEEKSEDDDGPVPLPLPLPHKTDTGDQDCPAPHFMATTSWTLDLKKRTFTPTTQNYRDIFFRQYPQLAPYASIIEVHHAIEQSVLNNYPGLFSSAEVVTDIRNLRGICGSGRALLHRSQMRLAWNAFYKSHPRNKTTRLDILKECQRLDTQYAYFFYPYLNQNLQPKLP